MEEAPKELNAKAYVIILKKEETLNQQLDEQLKAKSWVNSGIKVKIYGTVFLHSKEEQFIMAGSGLQETKSSYHQR